MEAAGSYHNHPPNYMVLYPNGTYGALV
jgi:hypothetical protein